MTHTNATRALTSTAERFSDVHPIDHQARRDFAARLRRDFAARLRRAINAAPKIRYPYGREAFEGTAQ